MNKWLFIGKVYHKRFYPKLHSFSSRVFYLRFPLSQITSLNNFVFSVDKWNLLSFMTKDHGKRKTSNLWQWAVKVLSHSGIHDSISEIELQTFPRILGFVFNPVSFWYCYCDKNLVAIIAEVNNTFGETHPYVMRPDQLSQSKVMQVSPFFQVEGRYEFSFTNTSDTNLAVIRYFQNDKLVLHTNISGESLDWTVWNILRVWISQPLMTFTVVFYIHLHAFFLYIKGLKFYGKNGKVHL